MRGRGGALVVTALVTAIVAGGGIALAARHGRRTGHLVASAPAAAAGIDAEVRLVRYRTVDAQGTTVPATGLVYIPRGTPPRRGWPVIAWAHETDGLTGKCAPSYHPTPNVFYPDATVFEQLVARGWEVVASDYVGEGNQSLGAMPGTLLPYMVADVAARNVVDMVRAVHDLPAADAGDDVVVWGDSEGAQAALSALGHTSAWAPELRLLGVIAVAPPSQLVPALVPALMASRQWPLLLMIAAGYRVAYGARVDELLTARGVATLAALRTLCSFSFVSTLQARAVEDFVRRSVPKDWRKLLERNDPRSFPTSDVPLLIQHGTADDTFPAATSAALAAQLCARGQPLVRDAYAAATHKSVVQGVALRDAIQWVAARLAGVPFHSACA